MDKKKRKPGWTYIYSEILNQEIAIRDGSGWVYTEDGCKYSPNEIELIQSNSATEIELGIHLVKKVFKGELVDVKGNDRGEQTEGRPGTGNGDRQNQREGIPGNTGALPVQRSGELDIF